MKICSFSLPCTCASLAHWPTVSGEINRPQLSFLSIQDSSLLSSELSEACLPNWGGSCTTVLASATSSSAVDAIRPCVLDPPNCIHIDPCRAQWKHASLRASSFLHYFCREWYHCTISCCSFVCTRFAKMYSFISYPRKRKKKIRKEKLQRPRTTPNPRNPHCRNITVVVQQ